MEKLRDVYSMIQTIFSVLGFFVAVFIPVWIMHNQRYENLLQNYLSTDFVAAIKGVVDFFKNDCNSDVNQIATHIKNDLKRILKNLIKRVTTNRNVLKRPLKYCIFNEVCLITFFGD